MKKNTRTLVITIVSFVALIIIATVAYNALQDQAEQVSFTPKELAPVVEQPEVVGEPVVEAEEEIPAAQEEPAATDSDKSPAMPDIPFFTLDGEQTSFEAIRDGKPVVINYFASWCPPCKQELPHFQKAYDTYKDQVSFIFLDALDGQRETLKTIQAFIEEFPFTGPVYYDEGVFAYIFQTTSLPTTVFINADGSVANGYLGFVSESVLEQNLQALLTTTE